MSIEAANVIPNFALRRNITAVDLLRIVEPAVIYEYDGFDSDGVRFFCYTVAGWLDGQNIATHFGGATVGGDIIVINAESREHADFVATMGFEDTINSLHARQEEMQEAEFARARLATIGALERMTLATKPDSEKSIAFVEDTLKLRKLAGDDLIVTNGH